VRRGFIILCGCVLILLATATAWAGHETWQGYRVVHVVVNGRLVQSDVPAINFQGRTLLPVRAVAEALGAQVQWDPKYLDGHHYRPPDAAALQTEVARLKEELPKVKAEADEPRKKVESLSPPAPSPSEPGYSRSNPAPIGTTLRVTKEDLIQEVTAEVTLLEVIRGAAAWERIKAANKFNPPPPPGKEYLLVRIRFKVLSLDDPSASYDLSPVQFTVVSGAGRDYEHPLVVVPPKPDLSSRLYVGASHEGWAVYMVDIDDPKPTLTFGRDYRGRGGIWFKLWK